MLYTIAFPVLSTADQAFVEGFRREHDIEHYDLIDAHFTLVFGSTSICEADYLLKLWM